ncbi:MAG: helix-turn-helix domain-containing protein, partial [Verrucomicrobiia bacterium]
MNSDDLKSNIGSRRRRFIPSDIPLERSPSLWDLIRCQEYLKDCSSNGKISTICGCICVANALFKIAFRNRCGAFKASLEQIAEDSGLSRATVARKLSELEKVRIVKINRSGAQRKPNTYTLFVMTDDGEQSNPSAPNLTPPTLTPESANHQRLEEEKPQISEHSAMITERLQNAPDSAPQCSQRYQRSLNKITDYATADNRLCSQQDAYKYLSNKEEFYLSNKSTSLKVINNSKNFPDGKSNLTSTKKQDSGKNLHTGGFSKIDDSRDQRTIMVKVNLLTKR